MKIRGEIVRKRPYTKSGNGINYLLFLKIHEGVMVDGVRIHTIPVLSSKENMNYGLGQHVDITGKIQFQRIITPSGNLSFSPIPVMISSDSGS